MNHLILDTHILIWLVQNPEKISKKLQNYIEKSHLYISSITCFEIVWLIEHNKIEILGYANFQDWFDDIKNQFALQILPVTCQISETAVKLPEHHKDPQDRIIIATALKHQFLLASADLKFQLYQELTNILIY